MCMIVRTAARRLGIRSFLAAYSSQSSAAVSNAQLEIARLCRTNDAEGIKLWHIAKPPTDLDQLSCAFTADPQSLGLAGDSHLRIAERRRFTYAATLLKQFQDSEGRHFVD